MELFKNIMVIYLKLFLKIFYNGKGYDGIGGKVGDLESFMIIW